MQKNILITILTKIRLSILRLIISNYKIKPAVKISNYKKCILYLIIFIFILYSKILKNIIEETL